MSDYKEKNWEKSGHYWQGYSDGKEGVIPEVKRLNAVVAEQQKTIQHLQAKIDSLMLEYCPEDMTAEQVAEWEKHQVPSKQEIKE